MTGKLLLSMEGIWFIRYTINNQDKLIPVVKQDYASLTTEYDQSIVNFEIVNEFTHHELFKDVPWGESIDHAKIIFN